MVLRLNLKTRTICGSGKKGDMEKDIKFLKSYFEIKKIELEKKEHEVRKNGI